MLLENMEGGGGLCGGRGRERSEGGRGGGEGWVCGLDRGGYVKAYICCRDRRSG